VLYQKTLNLIFAAVRTRNLVYTRYRFWLSGLYCRVVLKVGSKVTERNGAPVFILYPQNKGDILIQIFEKHPHDYMTLKLFTLWIVDCRVVVVMG
jgi:hypothetical protein